MSKAPPPPLPKAAPDLCGKRIGDFQVLRKLGAGGMGEVYLAEQLSLKRNVALKILKRDLAANETALERFKQEAAAVARATHANIVQVYQVGDDGGLWWMALEYVEGFNLRDYVMKKGPLELPLALSVMRQVASALQRASELGIIHRDIKPENILMTRKGEAKVADFGLSRCLESDQPALNLTATGVTMGTPLYMSPEQVEGKPVDPRTDIYSFGVTCYHLLSGQPPFRGESAFEVALAHVQKQPAPLSSLRPDLPEGLAALVHKMMAKRPDDRPQTGKEILRDLAKLRETMSGTTHAVEKTVVPAPASDPSQTLAAAPPAPPGRGWGMTLGIAAVLVAAMGGAAVAWRQRTMAGPLPHGQEIAPGDAAAMERIPRPSTREKELRASAELFLGKAAPASAGASVCMDLGLFYLDEKRHADAVKLFERMEKVKSPTEYALFGHFGRGIALAQANKPREANDAFRLLSSGPKFGEKRWRNAPLLDLLKKEQKWRGHLEQARWHLDRNGTAPAPILGLLLNPPLKGK
ncbi:MAG: serine/threonine protein kinase [Gemmataceae bacterium]|nr:serine/threonine protein kinase [Gemmataceae bacterium]